MVYERLCESALSSTYSMHTRLLRDHYRLEHNQTLVPTPIDSIRGIVQQTGENVNTHHNVQDWHLEESPELSCLYTLSTELKIVK